MNLEIKPIRNDEAKSFLLDKKCAVLETDFDFCISVMHENTIHGVIAMRADGKSCSLAHLYTDGTGLVGSILYGAAWRAAKALGYKSVNI